MLTVAADKQRLGSSCVCACAAPALCGGRAEGDVTRALTMLQAVFRAHDLPHVLHVGAAQALQDLTRPDTYFSEDEVGGKHQCPSHLSPRLSAVEHCG
jgi:hypothetical protein